MTSVPQITAETEAKISREFAEMAVEALSPMFRSAARTTAISHPGLPALVIASDSQIADYMDAALINLTRAEVFALWARIIGMAQAEKDDARSALLHRIATGVQVALVGPDGTFVVSEELANIANAA